MKGLMETFQGPNPSSTRWPKLDITSHLCKWMLKLILKYVISVKGTATYLDNHQSILLQWWPLGLLFSGDLTSLVPFP